MARDAAVITGKAGDGRRQRESDGGRREGGKKQERGGI